MDVHGPGFWTKAIVQKSLKRMPWIKARRLARRKIRFCLDTERLGNILNMPVEKLLTCRLRLVIPIQENQFKASKTEYNGIFPVIPLIGKIIPIPPAIKLLYRLKIIEDPNRTRLIQNYSDSVKTWAYLTKLTMELLSRGNFLPILDPDLELRMNTKDDGAYY